MKKLVCVDSCTISDNNPWYRASGYMTCKVCNKLYFDHPYCAQNSYDTGWGNLGYILHVLCNGNHVKL